MWEYRARLVRPYDGDSFWVLADVGFGVRYEPELRLARVHAPELREPGGPEVAGFVNDWFGSLDRSRQWPLMVATEQTAVREPTQRRTFTRYVAVVWRFDEAAGLPHLSLNAAVEGFLTRHPEWGPGE